MKGKGWKHKSYFYKFLAYFLMTLIIPVITISVLFLQAERKVQDEIILSNQSTLEQFFNVIDATAEEIRETCISVANNENCRTYAGYSVYQPERTPYRVYELKEILNDFMREKYYDIFVYFPNEDRVISGANSSLTSKYYYDTYYKKSGENGEIEDFMNILNTNDKRPALHVIRTNQKKPYLCASMMQSNYQNPRLSYSIAVVIRPEYLNELMDGPWADQGSIMMLNGEGKVLASSRDKGFSIEIKDFLNKKESVSDRTGKRKVCGIAEKISDFGCLLRFCGSKQLFRGSAVKSEIVQYSGHFCMCISKRPGGILGNKTCI